MSEHNVPSEAALGFSLQVDLGAGRVGTYQTFLPRDCALSELNAVLDKMSRASDRQRAWYRIEELERTLATEKKLHAQHTLDRAEIRHRFDTEQETREKIVKDKLRKMHELEAAYRADHEVSGRRSTWKPGATQAQRLQAQQADIEQLQDEMQKAWNEFELASTNGAMTHGRRAEVIAELEGELARCRGMVDKSE